MVCRMDQPSHATASPNMDAAATSPSQINTHRTLDKRTPRRRATSETDLTTSSPSSQVDSSSSNDNLLLAPPQPSPPRRRVTSDTEIAGQVSFEEGEEEESKSQQWASLTPPRLGEKRARALGVILGSSSSSSSSSSCASGSTESVGSHSAEDHEIALQRERQRAEQEQRELACWQRVVHLAQQCEQSGNLARSAQILERVLQATNPVEERRTISDPLRRAYCVYRLGLVEWKLGRYAASLDHLKHARDVYEPRDDGTQVLVEIYAALGQVAMSMGAVAQAKRYYLKALRTIELDGLFMEEDADDETLSSCPSNRPEHQARNAIRLVQAKVLRQLGILLMQTGKLDKAGTALSEAVSIQQALLGCWHVEYAGTLLNLGQYHEGRQDYATAACLYLDALDIYRHHEQEQTSKSSCRVDMGATLARIGWLYYLNKEYTEARSVYQEAYDCMSSVLGENHPNIASIHVQIGMLYSDTNQLNQALKRFKMALDIQREVYGDHHETVAQTLCLAAAIYYRQQPKRHPRMEKALQCVDHALQVRQDLLGRWHLGTGETLVQLGRVQHELGLARQTVESISTALEIYSMNQLPLGHPLVQQARTVLKKQKRRGKRE